jgi:hypothetical protein
MRAAASASNPSTAVSRKAWRGRGAIASRRRSVCEASALRSAPPLSGTAFQISENRR